MLYFVTISVPRQNVCLALNRVVSAQSASFRMRTFVPTPILCACEPQKAVHAKIHPVRYSISKYPPAPEIRLKLALGLAGVSDAAALRTKPLEDA